MEAITTVSNSTTWTALDFPGGWQRISDGNPEASWDRDRRSAATARWVGTSVAATIVADRIADLLLFRRLADEWRAQRGVTSSVTDAAMCPAYQSIIGMGQRGVPLILRQLQLEGEEPDQWFWALSVITGANPVHDMDRGNFPLMAQAWIRWGMEHGLLPVN